MDYRMMMTFNQISMQHVLCIWNQLSPLLTLTTWTSSSKNLNETPSNAKARIFDKKNTVKNCEWNRLT